MVGKRVRLVAALGASGRRANQGTKSPRVRRAAFTIHDSTPRPWREGMFSFAGRCPHRGEPWWWVRNGLGVEADSSLSLGWLEGRKGEGSSECVLRFSVPWLCLWWEGGACPSVQLPQIILGSISKHVDQKHFIISSELPPLQTQLIIDLRTTAQLG